MSKPKRLTVDQFYAELKKLRNGWKVYGHEIRRNEDNFCPVAAVGQALGFTPKSSGDAWCGVLHKATANRIAHGADNATDKTHRPRIIEALGLNV